MTATAATWDDAAPRRRHWWQWLLVAVNLALLFTPVLLLLNAPALARLPATPAAPNVPPLPVAAAGARANLDGLTDWLPLVVRDLPDAESQQAVREYDQATLLKPEGPANMLLDAWGGLTAPPDLDPALSDLGGYFAFPQGFGMNLDRSTYPKDLQDLLAKTMPALAKDPRNADRLNNAAVALFLMGIQSTDGPPLTKLGDIDIPDAKSDRSWGLEDGAVRLLAETERTFGPSRAVLLNMAYFMSVVPDPTGDDLKSALGPATRALALNGNDRTARLLLASLQSRQLASVNGVTQAAATLAPLLDDPGARPLGQAALGDAYLAAAALRQPQAPFTARGLAQQALDSYDQALLATTDPGVYAGRAAALDLLGEPTAAAEAERRAIELAPRSADLRLHLASLQEGAGDYAGMEASAQEALDMSLDNWDPPLAHIRLVAAPAPSGTSFVIPGDRGYLGYSYGSDRDHAGAWRSPQGGGYVVAYDLVPKVDDPTVDERRWNSFTPDAAVEVELAAATLLGDLPGAEGAARWWGRHEPNGNPEWQQARADRVARQLFPAAALATGQRISAPATAPPALEAAQTVLRHAGRYADAEALCQHASTAPPSAGFDRAAALTCAGRAAYLAGDYKVAAATLEQAASALTQQATTTSGAAAAATAVPAVLQLQIAGAEQAAGKLDEARHRFQLLATDPRDSESVDKLLSLDKLGDLDLDSGDLGAAVAHYNLALTTLDSASLQTGDVETGVLVPALTAAQHAHNNRGLAELRQAQGSANTTPDCARVQARCQAAQADFAAALAADGRNPLYLLNDGWAARLLGKPAQARTDLNTAAAVDPTLFPALNDLGVLQAQAGDQVAAEASFAAALRARPDYDLAAWNFGVLELQQGVAGIARGEAFLARAILRTPALGHEALAYKTDERVYRVTFGADPRNQASWAFGRNYSLAAAAFGTVTFLSVASGGGLLGLLTKGKGAASKRYEKVLEKQLPKIGGLLKERVLVRLLKHPLAVHWARWEAWLLTLPVLLVVTAWPAMHANPAASAAAAAMALFATASALYVHELGHRIAAWRLNATVKAASWRYGVALAILMLPVQVTNGPYVGHKVEGVDQPRAWWVYLAGPVANLLAAAVSYGLFFLEPLPLLRLLAQVHLAAATFALLPFEPLDGPALAAHRPRVAALLGLALAAAAAALSAGTL